MLTATDLPAVGTDGESGGFPRGKSVENSNYFFALGRVCWDFRQGERIHLHSVGFMAKLHLDKAGKRIQNNCQ